MFKSYFALELLGYALGLALTYGALALDIGGQQGQPALLYLVPSVLCPILLRAARQSHLKLLWDGFEKEDEYDATGPHEI